MMTFAEIEKKANELYPAMLLERYSRHSIRKNINSILFWITVFLFILMTISILAFEFSWSFTPQVITLASMSYYIKAMFFLVFSMWAVAAALEAFYFSYYFGSFGINFEVAKSVLLSKRHDLTADFLNSTLGKRAMIRLGVNIKDVDEFLKNKKIPLKEKDLNFDLEYNVKYISISDYGHAIYRNDPELVSFLERNMIRENIFLGALEWVEHENWKFRNAERWWTKESLSRIPSLGRNWSFGQVHLLEKFGHSIMNESTYHNLGDKWRIHKGDVKKIENVLVRNKGANVMLISTTTDIGMETASSFKKMILNGTTLKPLENKRIFVLDGISLWDISDGDKTEFERNLMNALIQANKAGNVILVIPRISTFIEKTHENDVDVSSLLSDFLSSTNIHIIGITDRKGYHETIETNYDLMQNFEKVQIEDLNRNTALRVLQDESVYFENKYDVFFTFQAIYAISEGVERYFVGSTYEDKILDLMEGVASRAVHNGEKLITVGDVNKLIAQKTGIPQGEMNEKEREKLGSLEEVLHRRVVGQNEAIEFIADAMRRARAGVNNPNRPIGSFLFLGPTGVGKTETTKALAESFFGSESQIIRFDMSEYTSENAVEKLIGSIEHKNIGVLSRRLREKQYGVLLLDELEKTTSEVLDLFLQIIDEGQFTDSRGETINTRNLIIVATSNAGSDLIYEKMADEADLAGSRDEVIDQIISRQIFKPELLNRFDGVVLFHPLSEEHLKKIAVLMLTKLNKRLAKKSISVDMTEKLISYLVNIGSDPRFGARAMNRAIQDEVEKRIANEVISGRLHAGTIASFDVVDGNLKISTHGRV